MKYPTLKQVEEANHMQLASWYRYLSSPGSSAVGTDHFEKTMSDEAKTLDHIIERFKEAGGMTPTISKAIDRRRT